MPALDADTFETSRLVFHDLGVLGLEIGGVDSAIRGSKLARILATLLVNANRRVSIDTLLEIVWGEQVSESSLATLETHIWRLRKLMEPQRVRGAAPTYLVNDNLGYRLVANPDNVDSLRFAQLAEQGDRLLASAEAERALGRYELALALWRGRPFEPVADDEWAAAPIARLEGLYWQLHEQRVEALLRTGATDQAVREAEALIIRLPYRERLWSQLMLGLYQAGRVEEALAAYRRAREVLLDTLGLDPGEQLHALHQRILDRDPALATPKRPTVDVAVPASPTSTTALSASAERPEPNKLAEQVEQLGEIAGEVHLPARLSALVGRAAELDRISRLVARSRLVTLVGVAGSGKTRLAIEVARGAASLAPDGVWFIDLAAVTDPAMVVDTVLSTVGIQQLPVGTPLAALRSYVRDRPVLFLVDNCEHVLPGVYQLFDALLGEDSQCRILATSREPVGLDGEVLWTLAPLAVQDDADPRDRPSPAAELFLARAISADSSFEATKQSLAEVEAICAAVDGIPLAIELAAGRIRSASLAEVHQQVSTELASLSRAGYVGTEHHRTVELSIDWSVRLIPDAERLVHARLSVLPGFFTVEAARAVAGADSIPAENIHGLLNQLVHRSLLAVIPGDANTQPTRFRQLATVRAHAIHALAAADATRSSLDRRNQWVAELVSTRPAPEAEDVTGWHERIEINHDTVAATLQDTLHDRPVPLGVRLAGQLESYWFLQGRVSEGERWVQAALAQHDAPAADVATAELTLAFILALRGRPDQSVPLVRRALEKAEAGNPRLLAHQLALTAWWMYVGEEPAHDIADAAVRALARDDPVIEAWADFLAAKTALAIDGPIATGACAIEVVDRSERIGNIHAAWLAGRLAGRAAMIAEDPVSGLRLVRRVLALHRRLGGRHTADLLAFEAAFRAMADDFEQATTMFGQASTLAFRTGIRWPIAIFGEVQMARIRQALSNEEFEAAWQAGVALAAQNG